MNISYTLRNVFLNANLWKYHTYLGGHSVFKENYFSKKNSNKYGK